MPPNQTHPVLIGCSGWSYPDWSGPFYPESTDPSDFLAYYADRFPVVEVDSSFYRPPTLKMVRGWYNRTPKDFKFALKVPQAISHQKQLRDCAEEVEGFVSSVEPLGEKLACALLQMGYFNRGAFSSLEDFLPIFDDFLAAWPHKKAPLAVETRNPRWVTAEFLNVLRRHAAALTLTEQKWMPSPAKLADEFDPVTAPFSFVRLIGDREAIEKVTTTWGKTVVDRSESLAETAAVIEAVAHRVPVYVFANNHYEGFSPDTVGRLRTILQIPEPNPPERPRTSLFD